MPEFTKPYKFFISDGELGRWNGYGTYAEMWTGPKRGWVPFQDNNLSYTASHADDDEAKNIAGDRFDEPVAEENKDY